ncbi:MAG: putative RND superfamily exporter protein [Flavobacteriales bacterium]|jgi:predicted RND superfamily exporter protein
MKRLFESYLTTVTTQPRSVLLLVALVTTFFALAIPDLKLDASADSMTLENDRDLDFYRETSKEFSSGDFLVVTFRPNSPLFSDTSLAVLKKLRQDLAKVEGVVGINSILDVPLLFSPTVQISEIDDEPRTLLDAGVDRDLARQEFWTSPIYRDFILGPDGQTTAMQLNIAVDTTAIELIQLRDKLRQQRHSSSFSEQDALALSDAEEAYRAHRTRAKQSSRLRVEQVREVTDKYRASAQIFVGGLSMIAADMVAFIESDLLVFGVAVVAFMILVLALIFRKLKFVVVPMASCLIAVVIMLGAIARLDWSLTVISSNFVALLMIISLAIIIHLVVRYEEVCKHMPAWDKAQQVKAALRYMARPCFYTSITTIVAFASLVVSGIRPVIDFGWIMTLGLVVALTSAFLILPAALMLWPDTSVKKRDSVNDDNGDSKVERKPLTLYFSNFVAGHGSFIIVVSLIVFGASTLGISLLKVENRFIDYFHDSTEIYQGLSVIDNDLGGTISLDIILDVPKPDAAELSDSEFVDDDFEDGGSFSDGDPFASEDPFDDDFSADVDPFSEALSRENYWMTVNGLKKIEWLHNYLDLLPEVGKVQSLAILYKVGLQINGSLNDFELLLMQKALSQEVRKVLISPYLSPDGVQTRLTLRIRDGYPGLKRAELVERIRNAVQTSGVIKPDTSHFTGVLVLYNNMLQSLFSSQILTLGAVFIAIFIMLAILFKSAYTAIIAILPNALAALSVLGLMGLLGISLDLMTITVASITVGIGVDHTIHYIHRYTAELKIDGDYIAAMHRSHSSIGRAMYYTAVIIIFGFGIMVLSKFIPTISFGLLTSFAMFASLMGSLLLLPQLILLAKPIKV